MKKRTAGRLSTEPVFIQGLITAIKKGEIKIPQFQRKFVWKEAQALELLDSIANNYPIGSLLIWKTHDKIATERNIGDFYLPDTPDLSPTDYVLDGQQRMTVIYSCLGAPDTSIGFSAGYDLETESFIPKPKELITTIFPLRWTFDMTKLLNFRSGLQAHQNAEDYQKSLDNLLNAFSTYMIPVVTLRDMTVEEVCPIFERINSSGTHLSTYDLMVAATWSPQFDLNVKVESIASSLEPKGFDDVKGNTILKCMSAIQYNGIKKEDIITLRELKQQGPNIEGLVTKTRASLLRAVDILSTEFSIRGLDFLPYEAHLIILSNICAKIKSFDTEKMNRLRQWFWITAVSERYRGASEAFISRDLELIYRFISNNEGEISQFGAIPGETELKGILFRSDSSRSRAFMLMLANNMPRNITNGAFIDSYEALSIYNKKHFHHIYPKAYLKQIESANEENCLLNICMLSASENIAIYKSNPNLYLPKYIKELKDQAGDVFKSNLLPDPTEQEYSQLDYDTFLDIRARIVSKKMRMLCGL